MESLKNNSQKILILNLIEIILVIFCTLFIIIIIYRYQLLKDEEADITTINDVKVNGDDYSIKTSIKSFKKQFLSFIILMKKLFGLGISIFILL